MITLQPMNIQSAAADLLWSRVMKNFPDLRVALSEGGTGWVPYFLERIDRTYDMHHLWTGQDFGDQLPSDVFREHFLTCFISDPIGVRLRDEIGIDNIAWEADYPHSDSMWPDAPEVLAELFAQENVAGPRRQDDPACAMDWYHFDPFVHVPRDQATVGALRAQAAGHDVSIKSWSTREKLSPEAVQERWGKMGYGGAGTGAEPATPEWFVLGSDPCSFSSDLTAEERGELRGRVCPFGCRLLESEDVARLRPESGLDRLLRRSEELRGELRIEVVVLSGRRGQIPCVSERVGDGEAEQRRGRHVAETGVDGAASARPR
ncbi:MAG: amidohydrolase family protein [Acidimicrobiales bacterium]